MPAPGETSERVPGVRTGWVSIAIVLSVGVIALSGCQDTRDDATTQARGAPPAEEEVASDSYPLLQSVPPRPQLSYTVQQQREIVEALIADRENARYTSQVVRYRSGLSALPPPPAPPAAAPSEPEIAEPTASASATPAPDVAKPHDSLRHAQTFDSFLRALARRFSSDPEEPATTQPTPPPDAPDAPVEQGAAAQAAAPDVAIAAGSVNDPGDASAAGAPHPPGESAVAARQTAGSDQLIDPAPLPPTETAVTARRVVVQAPRPPVQTAVAARETIDPPDAGTATPIPAPRPGRAMHANPMPASVPEPPPGKPAWPAEGRSAAVAAPHAVAASAIPTSTGARPLRSPDRRVGV
jgi:hypothetical protein